MARRKRRSVPDGVRRAWVKGLLLAGAAFPFMPGKGMVRANSSSLSEGVNKVKGVLYINGTRAKHGDLVPAGATVTTDSDSEAVIVIGRHAYLVHAQTEAVLPGPGVSDQVMTLVAGKLLAVFDDGPKTIQTPFASIGIRGTGIYMDQTTARLYVCLCYGTADYVAPDGRLLERLTSQHHDSPRYIYPPGADTAIQSAPVFDHTDDELKMLEWAVGRVPPFDDDPGGAGGGGGY